MLGPIIKHVPSLPLDRLDSLPLKHIPVAGQAFGFVKAAKKLSNSTDPVCAVKNATLTILEECAPPQVTYPVKCLVFFAQVGVACSTGAPLAAALAIGAGRQIIEEV